MLDIEQVEACDGDVHVYAIVCLMTSVLIFTVMHLQTLDL